ncbi:MAG TPA: family 20 glycosylhydrolase [Phenylobacterium sp.]|jgi:hexosaminidase|uniref:beta-N-acetylhexosaminidase n=1 Tax=Phenylobacterium sp. TaxID=1871053 RepID=UPI002D6290ED|nr:family 20 glycosylhydrolase [Phenylobacterium sp.]HZZ68232.1 family 20 glycosylhydrolase [Phenylobacterium sp.]
MRLAALAFGLATAVLAGAAQAKPVLMPQPISMTEQSGALTVTGPFRANLQGCPQPLTGRAVARLQADVDRLRGGPASGAGVLLSIHCRARDAGYLTLAAKEAYRLEVTGKGVTVDADGPEGMLRALATLRQLAAPVSGAAGLPLVRIEDAPRFAWRGVMIDTARHFMSLPTLKRQIDAMERVKLDVLHLHLSDNEGFRVESKLYPKLTGAASGGQFYTQAQVRDLVAYAADRGVRIVPEFDVPAHTGALVTAYPQVAAQGAPNDPFVTQNRALNPASEATYRFLDALLGEMAGLFPDRNFHVGGDEVSDAAWAHDPSIQAFMTAHGLANRPAMEAWFHARVRGILARHGKTVIGWEEIAATPIPTSVFVQAWRMSNTISATTAAGHPTVVSAGYYLDNLEPAARHYAIDPLDPEADGFTAAEVAEAAKISPLAESAVRPLELKPLPPLTPQQARLILGGEGELWSELVSDEMLDARLWPRAAALAERFWSPASVRDPDALQRRLPIVQGELETLGLQDQASRARMVERLAPGHAQPVLTFLETVAPVRNAAHNHMIRAMLRGQAHPPPQALTTLADIAPVDGTEVRSFEADVQRLVAGDLSAAPAIRARLTAWRDNAGPFAQVAQGHPDLEAALPISAEVTTLSGLGLDLMDSLAAKRPLPEAVRDRAIVALTQAKHEADASARPMFAFVRTQPPADLIVAIAPGIDRLFQAAQAER